MKIQVSWDMLPLGWISFTSRAVKVTTACSYKLSANSNPATPSCSSRPKSSTTALSKTQIWAVPCLRWLVASLSPRRPGFDPGSVHVGFMVEKVALGQVFPPSTSVFPCQFNSTGVPLLVKMKKKLSSFSSSSSQGCTISLKSAVRL